MGDNNNDDFTEKERQLLPQFRKQIADVVRADHDDHVLIKWIRARRHDLTKAEEMYRKSMEWRKEVRADYILEEYKMPEVIKNYYPGGLHGFDKTGRPVWVDPFGSMDCKGIMYSVSKKEILRYMTWRLEFLYKEFDSCSKKEGKRIDQCVHVLDMEGFGSKHLWKPVADLYIEVISLMESNYPETLKTSYIINVPKVFNMAYSFLKQFLPEDTTKKFLLFEKGRWQEKVFDDIDESQLPVYYSGTARDPDGDPKCPSKICYGGTVPDTYYGDKHSFFPKGAEKNTTVVGRGSAFRADYEIQKRNVALRYIFSTENGDISFGAYRKTADGKQKLKDMVEVEPMKKISSHIVPEDGTIVCPEAGTYVLVFDNSSSYFSKKKLTYFAEIINTDGKTKNIDTQHTESAQIADLDKVTDKLNEQTLDEKL